MLRDRISIAPDAGGAACKALASSAARSAAAFYGTGANRSSRGILISFLRTVRLMSRDARCGLVNEENAPVTPPQTCKPQASSSSCRTLAARVRPVVSPATGAQQQITADALQVQTDFTLHGLENSDVENSDVAILILRDDRKAEGVGHVASEGNDWLVYLLLSCDRQKTYVGVTKDFPRRLKQHNGELRGGAKSCRAGRPWQVVCTVKGFPGKIEAYRFEWAWKSVSKKVRRSIIPENLSKLYNHLTVVPVMRRRYALEKTVARLTFAKELEIDWQPHKTGDLPENSDT